LLLASSAAEKSAFLLKNEVMLAGQLAITSLFFKRKEAAQQLCLVMPGAQIHGALIW
jgi:hypothetical protein